MSEISGHSVKKNSSSAVKAHEHGSLLIRKPLSPVSSSALSKANSDNCLEDQRTTYNSVSLQKTLPSSESPLGTPSKSIAVGREENRTPNRMPIPLPNTPSTVSVGMTAATTPATPCLSPGVSTLQPIEYSFEEVRLQSRFFPS